MPSPAGSSGCCAPSRPLIVTAEQPGSHQVPAVKSPSPEKSLEELGLFCLAKRRLIADMIAVYKYIGRINTRKAKEQFKLKDNVDTRTNGYKLAMNKFRLEISRSFTAKRARCCSNLI